MTAEHLLDVYLDANVILLTVAALWFAAKHLMRHLPGRIAYLTQLNVLYAVMLMVVLSPIILLGVDALVRMGPLADRPALSVSDFLVSQYLDGNIALAPTRFEELMMLRTEWTHQVATLTTWGGIAVVAALLTGFAATMSRTLRNIVRVRRIIRSGYALRRIGRVSILITENTCVPFSTRGLWRHYIVLPSALLAQENDVRIAVAHEIQHVRQRDLAWELLLELVRPFYFWNPAFSYCKREVERMRELACDQQVLNRKAFAVRAYCECLLRVCRTSLTADRSNQIMTPSVPFAQVDCPKRASHSVAFLKTRVMSILDPRAYRAKRRHALLLMLPLIGLIVCSAIAIRPAGDWSQDRLMLSAMVNLERMNARAVTP